MKELQEIKLNWNFDQNENRLNFSLNGSFKKVTIVLKERTSNLTCFYWKDIDIIENVTYFVIPTNKVKLLTTDFSGFFFYLYEDRTKIFDFELKIVDTPAKKYFYSDDSSDLNISDSFYVQYLDFYKNPFLSSIVNSGDVVFDIGASCGTFAEFCLKRNVNKVICLEPSPSYYILDKSFDSRVQRYNMALGVEDGYKQFYFTNKTTLNSFKIDNQKKYDTENMVGTPRPMTVECISLKSLISKTKCEKINLLKIDIEGYEYDILNSLSAEDFKNIEQVLIEFHHNENHRTQHIVDKLVEAGFELKYLNLGFNSWYTLCDINGVIYGKKKITSKNTNLSSEKIHYINKTDDGMGIQYKLINSEKECDINVKIIDSFTGLTFHNEDLKINNECTYFTSHAYKLPNQIFKISEREPERLLFEKIINTEMDLDSNIFPIENKNLIQLIPNEMKSSIALGFSYFELYAHNTYNHNNCKIEKDDIVFDLGANCGLFARYCFLNGAKKVYSFEPTLHLKKCFEQLNTGFDYIFTPKAVYSKPVRFVQHENPLQSYVEECNDTSDNFVNLNQFINSNKVEKIDYLKIDIEGSEYDLFRTIDKNYLKNNVKKIALEYHNNKDKRLSEIFDVLEECGFLIEFEHANGINLELGMLYAIKNK